MCRALVQPVRAACVRALDFGLWALRSGDLRSRVVEKERKSALAHTSDFGTDESDGRARGRKSSHGL